MRRKGLSRRAFGGLAFGLLAGPARAAAPRGPLPRLLASLVPFASAPFPYDGQRPDDGDDFLDTTAADGRVGHTSPRGGLYYEDETYSDNRVLLALPAGFDLRRPAAIVVFFHGNNATLQRDVVNRQKILQQLQNSHFNAALVAPQFAVDALDSSAGRFWVPGAFARFMAEAATGLAHLWGARSAHSSFAALPIILVAYSGGYNPAAYALAVGGVGKRVRAVLLLDALVGEADKFASWISANRRSGAFFSAYTAAAAAGNAGLGRRLAARGVAYSTSLPTSLAPGSVSLVETAGVDHDDYMTNAWVGDPLTWLLDRVPGFER